MNFLAHVRVAFWSIVFLVDVFTACKRNRLISNFFYVCQFFFIHFLSVLMSEAGPGFCCSGDLSERSSYTQNTVFCLPGLYIIQVIVLQILSF